MERRQGASRVVALAALVLTASCSADDGGSGSGTTADPRGIFAPTTAVEVGYRTCDILPIEEVNAALGLALVGTEIPVSGDPRACQYGSYDGGGFAVVTIVAADSVGDADARYTQLLNETSGSPVDGVGDRAVIAPFSDRLAGQRGLVVADVYVTGQALLETEAADLASAVNRALAAGATVATTTTATSSPAP